MALITIANAKTYTERLAGVYSILKTPLGTRAGGAVAGNVQQQFTNLLSLITGTVNDYQQEKDLLDPCNAALSACPLEPVLGLLAAPINGLAGHCRSQGSTVDASIVDLDSYLRYFNGGSGGAIFANMVTPEFNLYYQALRGTYLTSANGGAGATTFSGVLSPALNPANGQANGMGTINTSQSFTDGAAVTQSATAGSLSYAEVNLVALVTTNFSGGAGAPAITVTGVDHLGNTGQTWTGTFSGNNPAATISQQTISSGSITAFSRPTVTVGSTAGIVPGSWVTINKNLPDQEIVLVETVPSGTTFSAAFKVAHNASATVDGNTTLTLTNGSSRRCRDVTGISLTLNSHNAGVVRVEGVQDRVGI